MDRDGDGIINGDEPPPQLRLDQNTGSLRVQWPFAAVGYRLEESEFLATDGWIPHTNAVELAGTTNVATVIPSGTARYFRLIRQP